MTLQEVRDAAISEMDNGVALAMRDYQQLYNDGWITQTEMVEMLYQYVHHANGALLFTLARVNAQADWDCANYGREWNPYNMAGVGDR